MNSSKTPKSVAISEIGYDVTTNLLGVKFTSGKSYVFVGVPKSVVASFQNAPSKGRFFVANIKGRYTYTTTL